MSLINFDDKFETLKNLEKNLREFRRICWLLGIESYSTSMKPWYGVDETEIVTLMLKHYEILEKEIESLKEECFNDGICPECGGTIVLKTWIDEDCGRQGYMYCECCGVRWDEEE